MMEINTTPLIDIMLVLLIMLIITIQLPLHSVRLALPEPPLAGQNDLPDIIRIAVDQHNSVSVDGVPLLNPHALDESLIEIAKKTPQPEVHIQVHPHARYDAMLRILAQSQRQGLLKIGILENMPLPDL